jgi:hypothetical protein
MKLLQEMTGHSVAKKLTGANRAAYKLGKAAALKNKPKLSVETLRSSFGSDDAVLKSYSTGYADGKLEKQREEDSEAHEAWKEKVAARREGRHYHESIDTSSEADLRHELFTRLDGFFGEMESMQWNKLSTVDMITMAQALVWKNAITLKTDTLKKIELFQQGSKIKESLQHPYSVKLLYKGKGRNPKLKGEIYEADILIGTFKRGAVLDGYVPPIEYKFRSEAAKSRFDDFADSLSIEETIEALIPINLGESQSLTDADKQDIINDFKDWSGGLLPEDCTPQEIEKYVEFALSTYFPSDQALEYLLDYAGY